MLKDVIPKIWKDGFDKNKLPTEYTLGKSHKEFFFNKGLFLHRRILKIYDEMVLRGFKAVNGRWNQNFDFNKSSWK